MLQHVFCIKLGRAYCFYFTIPIQKSVKLQHCVKSVCIWSYSGPHFSCIRTEWGKIRSISSYSVRMRENAGKMRTRVTANTDTFCAVQKILIGFAYYLLSKQTSVWMPQTQVTIRSNDSKMRPIIKSLIAIK